MSAAIGVSLSHLQAMLLFALLISIAFGFLSRRKPIERVKYIVWSLRTTRPSSSAMCQVQTFAKSKTFHPATIPWR